MADVTIPPRNDLGSFIPAGAPFPSPVENAARLREALRLSELARDLLAWMDTGYLQDGGPLEVYAAQIGCSVRRAEDKVKRDVLEYVAALSTIPSATDHIAGGGKMILVPREPSTAMRVAAEEYTGYPVEVWSAMIAAACPSPTEGEQE